MSASKLRIYWRLQLAAHFLQKHADKELLSQSNITTAQIGVLTVVANGTDVTQNMVAKALGLNESAITAMVKRLIRMGLVERSKSKADGRAKILELSGAGQRVVLNTQPPFQEINGRIEATLTDKEIDRLGDYLTRLTEAFK